jgi:hypothetical protein
MKFAGCFLACAIMASSALAAPPGGGRERKDDLVTLYMISLAADRCGFPMTSQQADSIDRTAKALSANLKLNERQNDAAYSEADAALEKEGPKACERGGSFAKLYKETLQKLTGP